MCTFLILLILIKYSLSFNVTSFKRCKCFYFEFRNIFLRSIYSDTEHLNHNFEALHNTP